MSRMEKSPDGEGTCTEEPVEWCDTGKASESSAKILRLVVRGRLARSIILWSRPGGIRRCTSWLSARTPEYCRRVLITSWSEQEAETVRLSCTGQMSDKVGGRSSSDRAVSVGDGGQSSGTGEAGGGGGAGEGGGAMAGGSGAVM